MPWGPLLPALSAHGTWERGAILAAPEQREQQNKASLDNQGKLQEGQMTAYLQESFCDHEARVVKM